MRLGRHFVISVPADSHALQSDWIEQSESVLTAAGFRDIVLSESQVHGTRGSQWHRLAMSVDPRRHLHTVDVTERGVTYVVQSRFPVGFSFTDEEVFNAEARNFLAKLSDTPIDEHELPLALARQRAKDKKLIVMFVLLCMLLATILAFILPV